MEYTNLTITTNVSSTSTCSSPSLTTSPTINSGTSIKSTSPYFRKNKFRIEGHRGFGKYQPENTYRAFTSAIDAGLDGIELDVWLTSDQVPVIIHTSKGIVTFDDGTKVVVTETAFEELRKRTILNENIIPTLQEVLKITCGKICVNIEFKGTDLNGAEIVLKAVQDENMCEQVQFSSFNWKFYSSLNEAAKKLNITARIPFGFLVDEPELLNEDIFCGQSGDGITFLWDLLLTHREQILGVIESAKAKGYNVKVYFPFKTAESDEVYEELESLGIETVITNEPHISKGYFVNKVNKVITVKPVEVSASA